MGFALLVVTAHTEIRNPVSPISDMLGAWGILFLMVPLVWMAAMFFVNLDLERRASERAVRDTCFAVMDEYAERVGAAEEAGGPAGLMRTFLGLPEGGPGVDGTRRHMAEQGCGPSQLSAHLGGWERRVAEAAEETQREGRRSRPEGPVPLARRGRCCQRVCRINTVERGCSRG